jgi:acyl dehydratase
MYQATGLYFEDFEIGKRYRHEASRTCTMTDSITYSLMCMDTEPAFVDEHWATKHSRNKRLEIHPFYVAAICLGVQVNDLTLGTTLGNLGMFDAKWGVPVYPGDSLRGETTILAKKESRTKLDRGVVEFFHEGFNHRDELVFSARRTGMMRRRPAAA